MIGATVGGVVPLFCLVPLETSPTNLRLGEASVDLPSGGGPSARKLKENPGPEPLPGKRGCVPYLSFLRSTPRLYRGGSRRRILLLLAGGTVGALT